MTSPSRPLTAAKPSPTLFAAEYVKDFNATQAAIRAGYSPATSTVQGSRLLRRADVQALVAAASQKAVAKVEARTEEAIGSAAWIIEKAGDVVGRALNAVPVRNSKGDIIEGEWTCNLGAATPALALLSKMHPSVFAADAGSGDQGAKHLHLHGLNESELRAIASGFGS